MTRARLAVITAALMIAVPAQAADTALPPAFFEALRAGDLRVATVGYRLFTANAALCREVQPQFGLALQSLDQFSPANRAGAQAAFGFAATVTVEAVVANGPAANGGLMPGDSLVRIGSQALPRNLAPAGTGTASTRLAAEQQLADAPPAAPMPVSFLRSGREQTVVLRPVPGCRTGVEMVLGDEWTANSDGKYIRIGSRFVERFDNDVLAVVIAHELAHTVLAHRVRLEAAGVADGMLKEVGRSGRLHRQVEDEADALSVALLYNAGYDPTIAARFWRGEGAKIDGGLFRARTHRSAGERAERLAAAAAAIPPGAPKPYRPALVDTREQPLR